MKTTSRFALLASALCGLLVSASAQAATIIFGSGANEFNMEFVRIGNPGNVADTTGSPNPAGAVPYTYQIGKFEVSEDMIDKANALGGLEITKDARGTNMPATSVTWNEAARFVNWLNTSQGYSPAYKFATQPGAGGYSANANITLWLSGDVGYNAANPFRNSNARYFLPSVNEWYKAAFFDPDTSTYFNFPTGSDTLPTPVASGTAAGTAVYAQTGPAEVTLAGGLSPYGIMGMTANVWDMVETESDLVNNSASANRMIRGGTWFSTSISASLTSSGSGFVGSTTVFNYVGFRVASVPEPKSLVLGAIGLVGLLVWRVRRRRGLAAIPFN